MRRVVGLFLVISKGVCEMVVSSSLWHVTELRGEGCTSDVVNVDARCLLLGDMAWNSKDSPLMQSCTI